MELKCHIEDNYHSPGKESMDKRKAAKSRVCPCMSNTVSGVEGFFTPIPLLTHLLILEIPFQRNHPGRRLLKVTAVHLLHGRGVTTTDLAGAMVTRH